MRSVLMACASLLLSCATLLRADEPPPSDATFEQAVLEVWMHLPSDTYLRVPPYAVRWTTLQCVQCPGHDWRVPNPHRQIVQMSPTDTLNVPRNEPDCHQGCTTCSADGCMINLTWSGFGRLTDTEACHEIGHAIATWNGRPLAHGDPEWRYVDEACAELRRRGL